jgi:hypothetical protein
LLAGDLLSDFRFRHPLRHIVDTVVGLQVAEESHPVVDIIFYYQITPAIGAFYDVLVRTSCQYEVIVIAGIRIFLSKSELSRLGILFLHPLIQYRVQISFNAVSCFSLIPAPQRGHRIRCSV